MDQTSELQPGRKGSANVRVEDQHSALAVGSGSEPVFATPMLAALIEAAALECLRGALAEGLTSLGVHLTLDHVAATPVGGLVTAAIELIEVSGRKLTFVAEARDESEVVGRARHIRVIVDQGQFADKLQAKRQRR